MTHFLQSAAWASFQRSLGRTVIKDGGDGWQYQAILEQGRFNSRLYCPYGPEVSSPQALKAALSSLKKAAATHHVTFIRIEPTGNIEKADLPALGLSYVSYLQLQPEHTQVINLTVPKDDIIAQMDQNNRNIYRNFHKKGLSIHTSQNPADINMFTKLAHQVAKRNKITPHSDMYFEKQAVALLPTGAATLYYATFEDHVVATAIVYDSDTTRYYAHAAADDAFRKLSASTALLGHIITDAKDKGLVQFDLYGIAPVDDPTHPWSGFTKFKKSFGGNERSFVGAWDLPIKRLPYLFYRLSQKILRHLP